MELEWDNMSENTFNMCIIPYFKQCKCSVHDCQNKARYQCKYRTKLDLVDAGWYSIDPKITFFLCEQHEKEEFLKLSYNEHAVDKVTTSY